MTSLDLRNYSEGTPIYLPGDKYYLQKYLDVIDFGHVGKGPELAALFGYDVVNLDGGNWNIRVANPCPKCKAPIDKNGDPPLRFSHAAKRSKGTRTITEWHPACLRCENCSHEILMIDLVRQSLPHRPKDAVKSLRVQFPKFDPCKSANTYTVCSYDGKIEAGSDLDAIERVGAAPGVMVHLTRVHTWDPEHAIEYTKVNSHTNWVMARLDEQCRPGIGWHGRKNYKGEPWLTNEEKTRLDDIRSTLEFKLETGKQKYLEALARITEATDHGREPSENDRKTVEKYRELKARLADPTEGFYKPETSAPSKPKPRRPRLGEVTRAALDAFKDKLMEQLNEV